jgi:membrane-associated phospholipid phosphatase
MKTLTLILVLTMIFATFCAKAEIVDTIPFIDNQQKNIEKQRNSREKIEYRLNAKNFILPASLITVGAITSTTDKYRDILPITRQNPHKRPTPFDDVFQYVVPASVFAFNYVGKEKHCASDQFFVTAISLGLMTAQVRLIKGLYNKERPYGGAHSFPSGHTATAFVGSHILYREFIDADAWIAYTGYAMGSVVAAARVRHDNHWVSDTMAGAGIAIVSTELAYYLYFKIRDTLHEKTAFHENQQMSFIPMVLPDGGIGASFSMRF